MHTSYSQHVLHSELMSIFASNYRPHVNYLLFGLDNSKIVSPLYLAIGFHKPDIFDDLLGFNFLELLTVHLFLPIRSWPPSFIIIIGYLGAVIMDICLLFVTDRSSIRLSSSNNGKIKSRCVVGA